MILKIFTIYDEKAKAYLPPFFLPESGMAIRTFKDCINSKEHQFAKNPDDYTLFALGFFNDASASMEPHAPKSLGNGLTYITPDPQPDLFNEKPIGNDAPVLGGPESGNSS